MSVTGLERLSGSARSKRATLLTQRSGSHTLWLTLSCFTLEVIFALGGYALILMLIPEQFSVSILDLTSHNSPTIDFVELLIALLISALVAPFYTMAGFALYINRRIELEAWDIEIRFRNLANRYSSQQEQHRKSSLRRTAAQLTLGLMFTCLLGLGLPSISEAKSDLQITSPKEQVRLDIDEVMLDKAFHKQEVTNSWRLKEQPAKPDDSSDISFDWLIKPLKALFDILSGYLSFGNLFSMGLELFIWLAVLIATVWVVYRYREHVRRLFSYRPQITRKQRTQSPEVLFGLDIRQESLPDDVPAEALNLWQQGLHRAAVGLLYRATLSELVHNHNFAFHPGHTERECAELVSQNVVSEQQKPLNHFVQHLTGEWQLLAYGHKPPAEQTFQQRCLQWREVFAA